MVLMLVAVVPGAGRWGARMRSLVSVGWLFCVGLLLVRVS